MIRDIIWHITWYIAALVWMFAFIVTENFEYAKVSALFVIAAEIRIGFANLPNKREQNGKEDEDG